ncbi:MAG: DNA starvation/stationary phase protection protein [Alphaproteobacteria bacterium]|nr:DNA starvation/stationary phase protection protein [Alphaproteobacteria bacterium]
MAKSSSSKSNAQMIEHLIDVLSGTYVLAVKTHGYHWNVTGPLFPQLHAMLDEQYKALLEAADTVAERIRALEYPAPGGMATFLKNSPIKEASGDSLSAAAMIKDLLRSHEQLRTCIEEAIEVADDMDDDATEDVMIERLRDHDKTIWMLRSQVA